MGYASKSGRASTNPSNPRAFGICDRCGFLYNHYTLRWQYDWAGAGMINKRLLVCNRRYDEPQSQLRAIIVPTVPVPVANPRVQNYVDAATDRRQVSGYNSVNQNTGILCRVATRASRKTMIRASLSKLVRPRAALNEQPGTDPNAPGNNDPGLPYGTDEVPETGPL